MSVGWVYLNIDIGYNLIYLPLLTKFSSNSSVYIYCHANVNKAFCFSDHFYTKLFGSQFARLEEAVSIDTGSPITFVVNKLREEVVVVTFEGRFNVSTMCGKDFVSAFTL